MAVCSECNQSLSDSQIIEKGGEVYKSGPNCSAKSGVHIFYRYEDFGMRDIGDGRNIVQSWCPSCRSDENPSLEVEFTCCS